MTRVLAALALVLLVASSASADAVDSSVRELASSKSSYKVRLAAALSLSKSTDPRAIIGLARSLKQDADPTVRRISALALEKMIDEKTAADAKSIGLDALDAAAKSDKDQKVRDTAAKAAKALASLKVKPGKKSSTSGSGPAIFVNVDGTIDQSKKVSAAVGSSVTAIVKKAVAGTGYATAWPGGGVPTQADLSSSHTDAYIVASTVKKIEISTVNGQTEVACTLSVRVSPWLGKDGGEKWEANKAASAQGSAKATTGNSAKQIQGGVRDCLEAVADDVSARQVVPFLKRVATSGS